MIQFLAPFLTSYLAPTLAASATPAVAALGTALSKPIIGSALSTGIASLLSGDDVGDALKNAAIGGVGGALGLTGPTAEAGKKAMTVGTEVAKDQVQKQGIGSLLSGLTGKEGILSPGNLMLLSMFAPKPKNPERKPYLGGGYYGPGGRYVPASRVFGAVEGGRIEGPGTPTSDSIPAMLSDGEFVQRADAVNGAGVMMGAKNAQEAREKGADFMYALQSKLAKMGKKVG